MASSADRVVEKETVSGLVQWLFSYLMIMVRLSGQIPSANSISSPAGEMDMPYSGLPGKEITPGANTWGVFPGGVCPRYKLSEGIVCEDAITPNNRKRIGVSADFFIIFIFLCESAAK